MDVMMRLCTGWQPPLSSRVSHYSDILRHYQSSLIRVNDAHKTQFIVTAICLCLLCWSLSCCHSTNINFKWICQSIICLVLLPCDLSSLASDAFPIPIYVDLSDWSAHLQCLDDIGVSLALSDPRKMPDILHLALTTGQSASDLPLKSPPPYLRRAVHSTGMYSTVQYRWQLCFSDTLWSGESNILPSVLRQHLWE